MNPLSAAQLTDAIKVIENAIAVSGVADHIYANQEAAWETVIKCLVQQSIKDASSLGQGSHVNKGNYRLTYDQWVHGRVLAMMIELSAWMGMQWESHFSGKQKAELMSVLSDAYDAGKSYEASRKAKNSGQAT